MNKILRLFFNPSYIFLCTKCHKITETLVYSEVDCKCGEFLSYKDTISETTRSLLEIKGEIKDVD